MPLRSTPGPTLLREEEAWTGRALLIGVDEVGRGPLAGPVVAAAIAFPPWAPPIRGVRDSKTLSALQRAALVPDLRRTALAIAVAAASVREIDRLNIRRATALAMQRAVARLVAGPRFRQQALDAGATSYRILLDGLPMPECGFPHDALVGGDAFCYSVAAAGVLAKELRDHLMRRLALRHPGFGWETNAGYGTAAHCQALASRGPTPHHRRSFSPVSQFPLET
jgi:ribonuclease HII